MQCAASSVQCAERVVSVLYSELYTLLSYLIKIVFCFLFVFFVFFGGGVGLFCVVKLIFLIGGMT